MRLTTAACAVQTARAALATAGHRWKYQTVEWSPKVALAYDRLQTVATHCVLPNLPSIQTSQERHDFFNAEMGSPQQQQRITTIATCWHSDARSLLDFVETLETDKILLVSGNDKSRDTMSSISAARILRDGKNQELDIWGVANPNDQRSVEDVERKVEAGMTGFMTQPLLCSTAHATLESYPRNGQAEYIAGLALPKTAKSLQFWLRCLDQPELEKDPLFRSHLAFFSQPYYTPIVWAGRELQDLSMRTTADGVHYMPLQNVNMLMELLGV